MGADQIHGLMDILGCNRMEEDPTTAAPSVNPASLTGGQKSQAEPHMRVAVRQPRKKDKKAIWHEEEFKAASGVVVKEHGDDRTIPKYDILHRQQVGASDAFLNLHERDGSTDHCEELLIKVWLPDTQLRDISLDVLEDRLLLQAPKYRLNLALPHKVKKDSGNAKWDKLSGLLSVVCPIDAKIKYFTRPDEAFTR